ncbi:serine/threonine protein kinase [Paenibacillus sp. SC116]|uniref:serine/threonine protein kinase n=1 Tax=Paenibacillus sp. SC116 TaxID=2968986 RepID=UPI00215A4DBA|nr:serine/threonine protein kinase [Paenibacillus sp. SC116]MCR8842280.1 serine/threonine protein kinase [Paenibacillus sp. SC116]
MTNNLVTVELDDVVFQLREAHDFSWLKKLGRVFKVFDQQDSGNISFGIERNGEQLFVKYAGARTEHYTGESEAAVANLKAAAQLYEELSHPALIKLIEHFEAGSGYATVFEWIEGESLHPHWSFPPPLKYTHPDSPCYRFKQLSIEMRLASLDRIFDFHVHMERKNYVAVDFYDGSLIYNFTTNEMNICDIDYYHKKPLINTLGTFYGSKRFMSPEEFILGAPIDERTNVFTMGAMAFALLGGELDRSFSKWDAGRELHEVALLAVSEDRALRYANVAVLKEAWDTALKNVD